MLSRYNRSIFSPRMFLSALLLSLLSGLLLSGCHFGDDEAQLKRGAELIKQHRFSEAESLYQAYILKLENKMIGLRASFEANPKNNPKAAMRQEKALGERLSLAYSDLATAFYESGKYGEAEIYFQKALETYRKYFGKQNTFIVNCLNSLATSYYKQSKLFEAERYYSEELEMEKKLLKPDSLSLAVTSNNLAAIYQKLGDNPSAERYFQWALNLCQKCKASEKEKGQLADILNNLAVFYEKQGSYGDAKEMVQKALEIEKDSSAEPFLSDKARSLMVLASIEKSFDLEASEGHYQDALNLIDTLAGGRPDLACEALEKYAELLLQERKFDEAEPIFKRAVTACEKAHGADHPSVAERLSEFSLLYRRKENYAEAERLLRRALAIQENTIGVDTAAFLTTVHRLAAVLADQKRYKEADELYQEILPKLKTRFGPDHPFIADTMDNWANYVEEARGKDEADELRTSARVMRRKIAGQLTPATSLGAPTSPGAAATRRHQ